jgi:hypothetical protein
LSSNSSSSNGGERLVCQSGTFNISSSLGNKSGMWVVRW